MISWDATVAKTEKEEKIRGLEENKDLRKKKKKKNVVRLERSQSRGTFLWGEGETRDP